MGELTEVLELWRAGATEEEVDIVLKLSRRRHAPQQLPLPVPTKSAAVEALPAKVVERYRPRPSPLMASSSVPRTSPLTPEPRIESLKDVTLEFLPAETLLAAPSGTVWRLQNHPRISQAKHGARFKGKARSNRACRAGVFGVFQSLKLEKLITTSSTERKGFTTVTKK
jgi:hypothetical protein